ncbi:sensor histidine kinase [Arthrobacter sp. 92]|uniref:sensor histidine kinase n=1 Tax=Arthrobacter sp. 92 TaxID=3418175 RepID=UPI003D0350A6
MTETSLAPNAERFFRELAPRAQVVLCQLPLASVTLALALAALLVWPGIFSNGLFVMAMLFQVSLFIACALVPWENLGPHAPLFIPMLDFLAIWLTRTGAPQNLPGLGALAIFPVIWLSASVVRARTSLFLSFFGTLLIAFPSLFQHLPGITPADVVSALLLPLLMLTVSLAVRFASVNLRLQHRNLEAKDRELQALFAESKDRERLLHTILETVDVGIIAVNSNGDRLLTNNRQAQLEAGAIKDNSSEIHGEAQLTLLSQDGKTPLPAHKRPVYRAAEGDSFADYLVWFGEGPEQRAISTAARSIRDDDGGFGGAVVVFNDVTGLVEAIAAKDDFLSNVTHELRTPLNSVIGNLDLVLDGGHWLPPVAAQQLEVAHRNSERLLALVSDLLVSASAASYVHPRRTDLSGLVDASVGTARVHAAGAGVSVLTDVPVPLWAHVDPIRIGQVLDNLVSNAIKYSPGGGTVRVSARADDGWVQLQVRDAGMGMTPADAARVFSRFFRSSSARDAGIPGIGLGLSITKEIVELHGGSIVCESQPDRGSTFTVALPAEGPPPPF